MRYLIILIVIVAALGGGYYIYWHKYADEAQQATIQAVEQMNAATKPFTKDLPLIKYEAVKVTGFPMDMVIEITKPVINVPVSALIQESQLQKGVTTPLPYEWVEEVTYGDKITLTGNRQGTHFSATASGERTDKALVNRSARHSFVGTSSSPLTCSLNVDHVEGSAPWSVKPAFSDPKAFLALFRSFKCDMGSDTLKDAVSGTPLLSSDSFSFAVSNDVSGANHKMALLLDFKNGKATPAFDTALNDYMLMYYTLQGKADEMVSPFPFSEYGNQDFKIDIDYDGPTEASAWADPNVTMHFNINHFDLNSALNTMSLQTHVATVPQGTERTLSVVFHEDASITKEGDDLSKKHIADMLATLQKNPGNAHSGDPAMEFFQMLSTLGGPTAVVNTLYPDLHSLGKMALDVDFNIKGVNDNMKFFRQGTLTLNNIGLTTTPYGIHAKGKATSTGMGMPSGDISIACDSCDPFVTDLGNYAMRVESAIDRVSNPPKQPFLNKELIDSVKQFLHGIAKDASASNLVIDFVANGMGFTVSGKQLPEVMALYMTTIAPHLPQPTPPAGGQPEPTLPPGAPPGQ